MLRYLFWRALNTLAWEFFDRTPGNWLWTARVVMFTHGRRREAMEPVHNELARIFHDHNINLYLNDLQKENDDGYDNTR